MSEFITNVSDASFEDDVIKAEGPVLVDYWAEWCGPCKMIAPVLDEIAQTYAGKLKDQEISAIIAYLKTLSDKGGEAEADAAREDS